MGAMTIVKITQLKTDAWEEKTISETRHLTDNKYLAIDRAIKTSYSGDVWFEIDPKLLREKNDGSLYGNIWQRYKTQKKRIEKTRVIVGPIKVEIDIVRTGE
jgi:hypothetical protein